MTAREDYASNFIATLQTMASKTAGHILIQQQRFSLYLDGKSFLHRSIDDDFAHGDAESEEKAIERFAALQTLLEHQASYDKDETYCVVVTNWKNRAKDIARYVTDTLEVPVVPMLLTPKTLNDAFTGLQVLSDDKWSAEIVGLFDGGHRHTAIR